MHRCLQIPEIFLGILDGLEKERTNSVYINRTLKDGGGCDRPACKPDCFALALTCKQFLEPALDALWINLGTIRPLLPVLLNVEYSHWKNMKDLRDMKIKLPLQVENWKTDRFAYYARRIRALGVGSEDMVPPIHRILSMKRALPLRPIFPKLGFLEWSVHDLEPFSYITLFAGPSLQSLNIYPGSWCLSVQGSLFHGLSTLAEFSPRLEHLMIHDRDCEDEDNTEQTDLILSAFSSLSTVSIETSVSANSFLYLANMPQLRSLTVAFYCYLGVPWMMFQPPAHPFPVLQDVAFEFGEVLHYAKFFDSFQRPHDFEDLHVMSDRTPSASEFDTLVKSIHKACSPTTLRSFYFASEDVVDEEPPLVYTVGNVSFSPFLVFRQMKYFSVLVPEASWDDTLLEAFAKSWPNLRELRLQTEFKSPCNFTVGGLYPLAKYCGCLQELQLPLSFSDVDVGRLPRRDWDKPSARHKTRIYSLVDGHQDISSDIMAYFEDLFPSATVCQN